MLGVISSAGTIHSLDLEHPISGSPLMADFDGDGRIWIAAGALRMGLWRVKAPGRISTLSGWPRSASGPFASSPAAGDINGDGRAEIVAGSEDGRVHAWRLDGSPLPGFPVSTGGGVRGTPALADLDGDGRLEIVVGSDDGGVYVIDGKGRIAKGWPVMTGGHVTSSPAVADLNRDGRPEIVVGSWDRRLYVIRADGQIWSAENGHPEWPVTLGHILWSSPLIADLDGDGLPEIAVAADLLHVLGVDGRPKPGWPQWIGGFTASSAVAADLDGHGGSSLVIGGDGLHVFDAFGRARPGFPLDLGGQVWARPLVCDRNGDGSSGIYVGSWAGRLYGVSADGDLLPGFPIHTEAPIVGAAAAAGGFLVFGSRDGRLRILDLAGLPGGKEEAPRLVPAPSRRQAFVPPVQPDVFGAPLPPYEDVRWSMDPFPPRDGRPTYLHLDGVSAGSVRAGMLTSRGLGGEERSSPFLTSRGSLLALVEPLPGGSELAWHVELEGWAGERLRYPAQGEEKTLVRPKSRKKPKRFARW